MNLFWAIILGITQGLTEFFPVSSSAHLAIFPWMFKFPDPGLAFDIALHAGTFFAIIIAFFSEWKTIAKAVFIKETSFEKKLAGFLIITSVPGAIFGYFLEEQAKTIFRNPLLIAATLVLFGFVLYGVDRIQKKAEDMKNMNFVKALLIGLSQAIAIIPGVSRSGATISAGRAIGFSREAAVKYSFLAAMPIIFGASIFGLRKVSPADLFSVNWIAGFIAAAVASFFAMKFLLSYVKKNDFGIFLWYRIALAVIIVVLFLTGS